MKEVIKQKSREIQAIRELITSAISPEVVGKLRELKIDISNKSLRERQLVYAIIAGNVTVIDILVKNYNLELNFTFAAKAKPHNGISCEKLVEGFIYDDKTLTPLMLACCIGNTEIIKKLHEYGARVEFKNSTYRDTLMFSVLYSPYEIAKCVLNIYQKNQISIDDKDYDPNFDYEDYDHSCMNALMFASILGFEKKVSMLIDAGADVSKQGGYRDSETDFLGLETGSSPTMMASANGHFKTVKALHEAGASVNTEVDYDSPLLVALINDHDDLAKYLIAHGANVNHMSTGRTLLEVAITYGLSLDMVKYLINNGAQLTDYAVYNAFERYYENDDEEGLEIFNILLDMGVAPPPVYYAIIGFNYIAEMHNLVDAMSHKVSRDNYDPTPAGHAEYSKKLSATIDLLEKYSSGECFSTFRKIMHTQFPEVDYKLPERLQLKKIKEMHKSSLKNLLIFREEKHFTRMWRDEQDIAEITCQTLPEELLQEIVLYAHRPYSTSSVVAINNAVSEREKGSKTQAPKRPRFV